MPYLISIPIVLLFHGLISWFSYDSIQGEVYTSKTKEAIPYVNIWIKQKDIRLTSNSEGKFIFRVNSSFYQDTVVFSAIGYKPLLITIKQLLAEKNPKTIIFLQEDTFPLQEVLIRPLTARQIVQKAIESIPENHFNVNYQVNGFYRKAIKEDSSFASLIESVVKISKNGYAKQPFQISYIKSRLSEDYRTYKLPLEKDIITTALELDHIQYRRGFLNSYNQANWQFKLKDVTKINHQEVYIIQANLMGNDKTAVHQAKIYIRSEDYAFQKIDYDYTWDVSDLQENAAPSDTIIFKRYNWKGSFNYIPYRGKMVLNYFHFVFKQNVYSKNYVNTNRGRLKNIKKLASQESHEEFIANEIKVLSQPFHKTKISTLSFSESTKPYDETFWKNYLQPVDTKLFITIKRDLEKYAPLERLFDTEVH